MLRRRGLAVAAFLVLSLLVQAQARLHWGAHEDEPDSVASSLVEALPYDDPATDVDPRTDRSLGEAEEAEGDGEEAGDPSANEKHKETIAEVMAGTDRQRQSAPWLRRHRWRPLLLCFAVIVLNQQHWMRVLCT